MRDSVMRATVIVRAPLEFLAGHHDRQGVLCAGLDRLARGAAGDDAAEAARLILDYLTDELPLHVADEEEDLMPALRRRCGADDDLEGTLARLADEHDKDETLQACLLPALKRLAAGQEPADAALFRRDAAVFAALQRRHLAWENGTLLPLARQRLTAHDLALMAAGMNRRRGMGDSGPG